MAAEAGDGRALCSCGAVLADRLGDGTITVGDDTYRFRRTTDFVACTSCGSLFRIGELHAGVNDGGEPEGSHLAQDALSELQALAAQFAEREPEDVDAPRFDLDEPPEG